MTDVLQAEQESKLVKHTKRELAISGAGDDYDGLIGDWVLELIQVFSKQGHSGGSAHIVTGLFNQLAQFKPLGPITNNPDEWGEVPAHIGPPFDIPTWQNVRDSSCFSNDGGKTYWDLKNGPDVTRTSVEYDPS